MPAAAVEVAVIGAGVVGCAVASALARDGRSVAVLEREPRACTGISARNSGVVHSGLYYPPDSLKARACIDGRHRLYAWAQAKGVPHERVGKLVLACDPGELDALDLLARNAEASGVRGCTVLDAAAVARRQPGLPRHPGALWCPDSGIVDAHELTRSLLVDAEAHGATTIMQCAVESAVTSGASLRLQTTRGELEVERIVNCAGLHADDIATMFGLDRTVVPCRGDYFRLRGRQRFRHLLYPVKRRRDAGLGVHLVLELDGGMRLGPDVEWVEDKHDFAPAEHKHAEFLAATRRLLGDIDPEDLYYDGCGLRPKINAPDQANADFELTEAPSGSWHLLGIESPGLTAALSLAEEVRKKLRNN